MPPFNRVVPILFNGVIDLTATYLGEQIEQSIAKILSRELDRLEREGKHTKERRTFENFLNLLVEFRKVKNAPEHLEKIYSLLTDIERISKSSVGLNLKISNIRNELSQLPLIDEEKLLNIVFEIMRFASHYNVIYIFFFDECDEWLAKGEQESYSFTRIKIYYTVQVKEQGYGSAIFMPLYPYGPFPSYTITELVQFDV